LFLFFTRKHLWQKIVKCYIWGMARYDSETWTLGEVDQQISVPVSLEVHKIRCGGMCGVLVSYRTHTCSYG
jgi:hypothetical protein